MASFRKVIRISEEDYSTLINGGTITVGGTTYSLESDVLYEVVDTFKNTHCVRSDYSTTSGYAARASYDVNGKKLYSSFRTYITDDPIELDQVINIDNFHANLKSDFTAGVTPVLIFETLGTSGGNAHEFREVFIGQWSRRYDSDIVDYIDFVHITSTSVTKLSLVYSDGDMYIDDITTTSLSGGGGGSSNVSIYRMTAAPDNNTYIDTSVMTKQQLLDDWTNGRMSVLLIKDEPNSDNDWVFILGTYTVPSEPQPSFYFFTTSGYCLFLTHDTTVNKLKVVKSPRCYWQQTLVSGTNIKTINSTSLLGSGNISIPSVSVNTSTHELVIT